MFVNTHGLSYCEINGFGCGTTDVTVAEQHH